MAATAPSPELALDEQLCFALYAASRAVTARYRPLLDEAGLTYPQYLVLLVLWEDGPSTVSRLGHRLRLDSGTLSPLFKRLEAAGFVTRHRRVEDERSVEIRLSAKGAALRDRARAFPARMCAAMGLDADQAAALAGTLRALADAVSAPGN